MLKLDNNLLDELGLGALPDDQKRSMLQHIYETLELRVGTNLANQMTDAQLTEFEKFIDEGGDANQAQALRWLETNLPNYKQVVNDVFEALKVEVKQMAPNLLAASQQDVPVSQPAPVAAGPASAIPAPQMSADPYPQPSATPDFSQQAPTAPAPQFNQPEPPFTPPVPQQPAADPYQAAAPMPQPVYPPPQQQPVQPQAPFGQQPTQPQPVAPQPQQFTQPDPLQFGPQAMSPQQDDATQSPYPPQQSTGPQFPSQQPPAGPGQ